MMDLKALDDFRRQENAKKGKGEKNGKAGVDKDTNGFLAAMLQLTRFFANDLANGSFPINPENYRTEDGDQVKGISRGNCQKILSEYHIESLLAKEGGRTSRGTMPHMRDYADFVNKLHPSEDDFKQMERYWIERIRLYFAGEPLKLAADGSFSIAAVVDDLLEQAKRRQTGNSGTMYVGTVLQQLVAAKLSLVVADVDIHSAATADDPTNRSGDFNIGDTAIHCTTNPSNALIAKTQENIRVGLHPVIVTLQEKVNQAQVLADAVEDKGFADRLEVWGIQSFLSSNIFEHGDFQSSGRREFMTKLVKAYNDIIDEHETDPSLRIEYR